MVDSIEGIGRVKPLWRQLEQQQTRLNPFLTWEWQSAWWEVFGADHSPRLLLICSADQPKALVPLAIPRERPATLEFSGGMDLSDHLGYLCSPGEDQGVAAEMLTWAVGSGAKELDLHYLPEDGPQLPALVSGAGSLPVEEQGEEVSPALELPESFDAYLSERLGKKDRHELRRKLRRLDQERPGWALRSHRELGLDAAMDRFLWLLKASRSQKAEFLTPEVERFFRLVAAKLDERGTLRLSLLEAGGKLVAGTFGFTEGSVWYLYNSGYDPQEGALSPGLLCVAEGIRAAISDGCTRADLLRGNEAYKYRLGAQDRGLSRLRIRLPGGGG